jgi:hypothetical protein
MTPDVIACLPWAPTTSGNVEFDVIEGATALVVDGMTTAKNVTAVRRDGSVLCVVTMDGSHSFVLRSPVARSLLQAFPDGCSVHIESRSSYGNSMEPDTRTEVLPHERIELSLELTVGQLMYLHALLSSAGPALHGSEQPGNRRLILQKIDHCVGRAVNSASRLERAVARIVAGVQLPPDARAVIEREQRKIDALQAGNETIMSDLRSLGPPPPVIPRPSRRSNRKGQYNQRFHRT